MNAIDYIPFGAQYYRAPTPVREDFHADLEKFAEQGFNTIKIWLQWRWNNPAPGEYDFSDMHELLDIAQENGLKVFINVICDVAPAWFYKQYPDSLMRFADGRPLMPQTLCFRQIGGAPGPCYHHSEGIEIRRQFIEAAARELGDHPALVCWDLWNEPELTCGTHRAPIEEEMVCYCENTRREFIEWLQKRYGDIQGLNHAWGRNYRNYDEMELPIHRATFQDMVDWRSFFAETLAAELRMRTKAVKTFDKVHPVMVHTVPMPYFNMINACADEYLLAQEVDMFGNSLGSFPFSAVTATTAAKGKRVFNAEIHALGGDTFNRPGVPTFDEMKKHIFIPLGRGVNGFLFWQYKPERVGFEAPAWGLTDFDCNVTPWLEQAQIINAGIQANARQLLNSSVIPARIAIVNSGEGQVFTWCAASSIDRQFQSVKGFFDMLYDANYPVDVISEHQLTEEALKDYDCVIAPFPYYIREHQAEALRKWVAEGGFLISEALFGSYIAETNLHSKEAPGYGFTEVFGAKEDRIVTASHFQNAYGAAWATDNIQDEITVTYDGGIAKGYFYRESFLCDTAKPFAEFSDGVAVTVNDYGKGRAVMIGTLLGRTYAVRSDKGTAGLLLALLNQYSDIRPVATGGKHVDFLMEQDQAAFMLIQAEDGVGNPTIESPYLKNVKTIINILDGREYPVADGKVSVEMLPSGIDAFRICRD